MNPLLNIEPALFANMLRMVHEETHLEPRKAIEMGNCGECAVLTPKKELTQTGQGYSLCPKCTAQLGNFDAYIYDEEVEPERLFDGDGQPAGCI